MSDPIQYPFKDEMNFPSTAWSFGEREMLLTGVAQGLSWADISEQITDEFADRSPKACETEFFRIRAAVRE